MISLLLGLMVLIMKFDRLMVNFICFGVWCSRCIVIVLFWLKLSILMVGLLVVILVS